MHKSGHSGFRCAVKNREHYRSYHEANPEKARERQRRYREKNAEKERERHRRWRTENPEKDRERNARRIRIGGMYLGMCGFTKTEREEILNGTSL